MVFLSWVKSCWFIIITMSEFISSSFHLSYFFPTEEASYPASCLAHKWNQLLLLSPSSSKPFSLFQEKLGSYIP